MTNPLLTPFELPPFSKILPEHVVPAVTKALNDCRENVERVVAQGAPYTWENLCQPLAEVDDVLGRIFSPVSHLNSVKNSPELREAYEQTLPLLSEYSTWVGQHEGLYKAYRDLRDGDHYATLNTAQKKAVDNALRDFELSGIGLPIEKQQRYGEIATRLSELGNQYSNNVLDATMGWTKLVTDEAELAGMPESALAAAKAQAEAKELEGYLLTLDIPSYLPVMTYCDNQALREEMYRAYSTRASDQGPNAGKWDNSKVMEEILALRHELAQLLGFLTAAAAGMWFADAQGLTSPWFIVLVYLFQSLGELFISALGLAMIAALVPQHLMGFILGMWFLTQAAAFLLGGYVATFTAVPDNITDPLETLPVYTNVFGKIGLVTLGVAVVMLLMVPWLKRMIATPESH